MQKVLKFLVTALIIVVPLFQKFPAIRIPGIYVAIRLEDFLILFTFLAFLIPILKNLKNILEERISRSILLFLGIGLLSTLSGVYLTQSTALPITFLHLFRRIEYLSLFFVGFIYFRLNKEHNFIQYILKLLLVVNLFILLYGLGEMYLNFPVIITQNEEYSKGVALSWIPGSHINSTFAGHYDLASYLVLTLPFFINAFFVYKEKISKFIIAVSVGFGFWLLSVAVSRISVVAFLISTTIALLLMKKQKELVIVGIISVVIFGFSPGLRERYGRIIEVVREKISLVSIVYAEEKVVFEDRSTSIRLAVEWPRAMRAFYKSPFLGTGYSSITLATDNDYLRALGETGILGLTSFVLIFINMFIVFKKYTFDQTIDSALVASFIGSTVGILITAIFIDIFEASKFALTYWLLAGLVIGKISKNQYD